MRRHWYDDYLCIWAAPDFDLQATRAKHVANDGVHAAFKLVYTRARTRSRQQMSR